MNSNDFVMIMVIFALILSTYRWRKSEGFVKLEPHTFWSFVESQGRPIVFLMTSGGLVGRLCYVLPYQGILFSTDATGTKAPEGTRLIGINNSEGQKGS